MRTAVKRAVFLDRDGTLIVERNYLSRPDQVVLFPDTGPSLRRLAEAGFRLFIVTNQSGIGRGYYTLEDMHAVHRRLGEMLQEHGVQFDRIYFAPEAPEEPSRGRKPSPQFLFDARDEFGLDLARSYMVGDKLLDVECGRNAGTRLSLLVKTGYGADVIRAGEPLPRESRVVENLTEAADLILADAG
ncbi:MAG: HAD family hydrolase [Verrucomicrobia bacterium]|nr:HAD family hydrolase [Verrucomicrobiota bacterium]